MREYTTEQIEHRFTKRETCDICGCDTNRRATAGNANTVTVGASMGNVWPEGDFRTHYRYDVCPKCFEDKIVPFMESLGATAHERDGDDDWTD